MGSRVMHSIIAFKIAQQISLKDKSSFVLGGIAPDAVSPKERSHYYAGDHRNYTREIKFDQFLAKYDSYKSHPYILGYYTHLIADGLWLKGFYLPWLKNRMENNEEIFHHYHQDFHLLNGKLLEYYGVKNSISDLLGDGDILDLSEISKKDVEDFKDYLVEDMNYSFKDLKEDLTVFTFDQILGYIETSVEKGVFYLSQL